VILVACSRLLLSLQPFKMRAAMMLSRPVVRAGIGMRNSSSAVKDLPILVTGARGRVASLLIKELIKNGRKILATGRAPPADPLALWGPDSAKYVEFVQANLLDREAMDKLVARSGDVLHIGALPGPSHQPPPGVDPKWGQPPLAPVGLEKETGLELLEQNFVGTCGLFESVARKRDGCRVVYSSSLFASGYSHDPNSFQPPCLPLDETEPTLPLEHYGFSKFVSENFASMLVRTAEGARVGGADNGESPIYINIRFSNMIKKENWHLLPDDGSKAMTPVMWAYTHEDDVVDAHLSALQLPSSTFPSRCETFFIIADDNRTDTTTEELIKNHWERKGASPPELKAPLPGFTSIVSNEKAKRMLNWNPRTFRK